MFHVRRPRASGARFPSRTGCDRCTALARLYRFHMLWCFVGMLRTRDDRECDDYIAREQMLLSRGCAGIHWDLQRNAQKTELKQCKKEIQDLIRSTYCNPIIVRLAWHDCGTYDKVSLPASTACDGATKLSATAVHGSQRQQTPDRSALCPKPVQGAASWFPKDSTKLGALGAMPAT